MQTINLKRAYSATSPQDGYRVYVDRLWPRGLSHETFHYDLWDKEIAPSSELREWFHGSREGVSHSEPTEAAVRERWPEFEKRYTAELLGNPAFATLKEELRDKPVVTLLYSSRDEEYNNAVVLSKLLKC